MRSTLHLDLLVPLSSNSRCPFPDTMFSDFEDYLLGVAAGFTRHGDVEGAWRDSSGQVFRDSSRSYSITVGADEAPRVVRDISAYICRAFDQKAAYVEAVPTFSGGF